MNDEAPPRLTKKPIPVTFKRWKREYDGIKKFLSELSEQTGDLGANWVAKQTAYYKARLQDLENARPSKPTGSIRRRRDTKPHK